MKTTNGKNLSFSFCQYLSPIYLPSPRPILSVYKTISRCPIDRIQIAYDSAIDTSWFLSAFITCSIWQFKNSLGLFVKHNGLKRDRIHTRIFLSIFRFKFAITNGKTSVPSSKVHFISTSYILSNFLEKILISLEFFSIPSNLRFFKRNYLYLREILIIRNIKVQWHF